MYERRVEGEIEGLRGERKRQRDRQRERDRESGEGEWGERFRKEISILVHVHVHVCAMCILAAYYLCPVYGQLLISVHFSPFVLTTACINRHFIYCLMTH